jgi:hypothetical protein
MRRISLLLLLAGVSLGCHRVEPATTDAPAHIDAASAPAASDAASRIDAGDAAPATVDAPVPRRTAATPGPVKRMGTITDMDFSCWADRQCAIRVDDVWVVTSLGGPAAPVERGRVVGIAMSGAPADELKQRYVGRRAEVFAERTPLFPVQGQDVYDDAMLTLAGSKSYYLRLVDVDAGRPR